MSHSVSHVPSVQPIPCGDGHSLFRLVDQLWLDGHTKQTMHRICTMMRLMGVETAVREDLNAGAPEYGRLRAEENAIRRRLRRQKLSFSFLRVTFLNRRAEIRDLVSVENGAFLGYVTIVNVAIGEPKVHRSYVLESVIRDIEPAPTETAPLTWISYLHVKRTFSCTVGRRKYEIPGSFFCQQNTITSVCAHACTSMMLNNSLKLGALVTCEDINRILGINHTQRMQEVPPALGDNSRATHEGLFPKEIARVLREYGFRPYVQEFRGANRRYYRGFLYSFIESGFPALLTFDNMTAAGDAATHVVAVVGHSMNRHSWLPTAYASYARPAQKNDRPYLSTLNWVNDFIVHDDNFGMQLCLPAHSFRPEDHPDPGAAFVPSVAIGVLPEESSVELPGHIAEHAAWERLCEVVQEFDQNGHPRPRQNYYVDHLQPKITGADGTPQTAVMRTLLMRRDSYLEHLRHSDNEGGNYTEKSLAVIAKVLNRHPWLWVVEVSEPDLYIGNQAKVIDVLVDPTYLPSSLTQGNSSLDPVIAIRFPHSLVTPSGEEGKPVPCDLHGITGHMPMARFQPH